MFCKISTPACYGTNHAVAAGVEKFPPHPHDNHRHATNHTSTTTPAPLSIHTLDDCACDKHAHKKPFASMVPNCPAFDLEALRRQIKQNEEALQLLQQFLASLPEPTACTSQPDPFHEPPTPEQQALAQAITLALSMTDPTQLSTLL